MIYGEQTSVSCNQNIINNGADAYGGGACMPLTSFSDHASDTTRNRVKASQIVGSNGRFLRLNRVIKVISLRYGICFK